MKKIKYIKKYLLELIIIILQIILFYGFPLFAGPTDIMGMVLLMIYGTFLLSVLIAIFSKYKLKYSYFIIVTLVFIPSIYIYYNSSAWIHVLWYLVDSLLGLIIGISINRYLKKKN